MANFGVDVTIVEFLDRMVPTEDADISKELAKHYKKLGVKVLTSTAVKKVEDTGSGVKVTIAPAAGGDEQVIEADKFLAAFGFAPRVDGLRPRGHRRRGLRARRDRDRRLHAHQRRQRLRHR